MAEFSTKAKSSWCKACIAARQLGYHRKLQSENPGYRHGLSTDQFWDMWETQGGQCAICSAGFDLNGGKRLAPCVDHDHAHCAGAFGCSDCVRSLLCNGCNYMLGRSQDNPAILRHRKPTKTWTQDRINAAIAYLERWHVEMAKRGVRPPLDEALWQDLFGAVARLITAMA